MNHTETKTAPRLWSRDGFRDDEWERAETPDLDQRVIVPLAVFAGLDDAARGDVAAKVAVEVQPGDRLDDLVPYLDQLPMIALCFPVFSDGRSFSKAELLRSRHGYRGTLRATGDVLIDQIPHMLRTGIDEFEISNETAINRLEEGRIGGIEHHYQPAAASAKDAGSYSWRRLPA